MTAAIDVDQLADLRILLDEDFDSLIHTYLDDSQQRLFDLKHAYAQADNAAAYDAVHALKGASSHVGATTLTQHCHDLQNECRANRLPQSHALIQAIESEFTRVHASLLQELN